MSYIEKYFKRYKGDLRQLSLMATVLLVIYQVIILLLPGGGYHFEAFVTNDYLSFGLSLIEQWLMFFVILTFYRVVIRFFAKVWQK